MLLRGITVNGERVGEQTSFRLFYIPLDMAESIHLPFRSFWPDHLLIWSANLLRFSQKLNGRSQSHGLREFFGLDIKPVLLHIWSFIHLIFNGNVVTFVTFCLKCYRAPQRRKKWKDIIWIFYLLLAPSPLIFLSEHIQLVKTPSLMHNKVFHSNT